MSILLPLILSVRIVNNGLDSYFLIFFLYFSFLFLFSFYFYFLDLNKECDIMSYKSKSMT